MVEETLSQRTNKAIYSIKGASIALSENASGAALLMFDIYAQALRNVALVRERRHVKVKHGHDEAEDFLDDLIYLTKPEIRELELLGIDNQFVLRKLRQFEVIQ